MLSAFHELSNVTLPITVRRTYCDSPHFTGEENGDLFSVTFPVDKQTQDYNTGSMAAWWGLWAEINTVLSWKSTTHIFGIHSLWFSCWPSILRVEIPQLHSCHHYVLLQILFDFMSTSMKCAIFQEGESAFMSKRENTFKINACQTF